MSRRSYVIAGRPAERTDRYRRTIFPLRSKVALAHAPAAGASNGARGMLATAKCEKPDR